MEHSLAVVESHKLRIERLPLGPWGTNSYLVICKATGKSALVDAPGEAERVEEWLRATKPKYILMTHNHRDHIGALAELRSILEIPVAAHAADAGALPAAVDTLLADGQVLPLGDLQIKVVHTPGHTPGSLCYLVDGVLVSGDTLFPGGPGSTRTPAALAEIIKSITEKLFVLPDDTPVHPGHGDATVLKKEKAEFAVYSSRPHDPNLCGDVAWLAANEK
ncbi:MAG: MBL fold metallo-hydrolase [Chloroflexi bacterium]|nr:MBL fold metallo-hydrolase [Chloroflexota bacterium]